jgi:hypothetical protein
MDRLCELPNVVIIDAAVAVTSGNDDGDEIVAVVVKINEPLFSSNIV